MILKILLKYLIIIQELIKKIKALWQVKYAVVGLLIARRAERS